MYTLTCHFWLIQCPLAQLMDIMRSSATCWLWDKEHNHHYRFVVLMDITGYWSTTKSIRLIPLAQLGHTELDQKLFMDVNLFSRILRIPCSTVQPSYACNVARFFSAGLTPSFSILCGLALSVLCHTPSLVANNHSRCRRLCVWTSLMLISQLSSDEKTAKRWGFQMIFGLPSK